jgi:hypothetical protein
MILIVDDDDEMIGRRSSAFYTQSTFRIFEFQIPSHLGRNGRAYGRTGR